MKYLILVVAAGILTTTPACQTCPNFQPKAKLIVEAPHDLKQANYKLEVTCE